MHGTLSPSESCRNHLSNNSHGTEPQRASKALFRKNGASGRMPVHKVPSPAKKFREVKKLNQHDFDLVINIAALFDAERRTNLNESLLGSCR